MRFANRLIVFLFTLKTINRSAEVVAVAAAAGVVWCEVALLVTANMKHLNAAQHAAWQHFLSFCN